MLHLQISKGGGGGGADVKTGTESGILENTERTVSFSTAFTSIPDVICEFSDNSDELSTLSTHTVSTTGFTIKVNKIGGGGSSSRDVEWIATDSGNP